MIYTEQELSKVANMVLEKANEMSRFNLDIATIILLSGELGSGKTTLVQAIARELGITEILQSPTFVLMRKYSIPSGKSWKQFVHIDAYRLEGQSTEPLGFEQLLKEKETIVLLEWPERIQKITKYPHILCNLKHISETEREIEIKV